MLRKNQRTNRGAWRINTAQAIIILIAIGGGYAAVSAYQKSKVDDTVVTMPSAPPVRDPSYLRYAGAVAKWQTKLSSQQMTLTWPYNNQDFAVRLDLPDKIPITLAAWDTDSEAKVAVQTYRDFVRLRAKARIANPPSCIVHIFAPSTDTSAAPGTMEEVMDASAAGVGAPAST